LKRWWGGVLVAATMVVAGCIELSTDPDEIVAISIDELPWPSVVAGDTLRDASGAVAPLVAHLFNGSGDEVTGPVEFFSQEPFLRFDSGNRLIADATATTGGGVFASTLGVQSIVRQVEIVPVPRTLAQDGTIIQPLQWVVPDDPQTNTSQPMGVRVLTGPNAGVRSWIVYFQLEAGGRVIPESDTTQIFLIGDNGRPSYVDTTDASGRSNRRVRLRVVPGLTPPDSAVITVNASYKGAPLAGSPVRMVLPIIRATANISR
jgi:hypothetical protein